MSYSVKLDNFEGPMDLLLYFIQRDKLNIYDISIRNITKEYLEFINVMKKLNIEIAGEFIMMAAMLMRIKSRMLLPRIQYSDDELLDDPRTDLIRRLVEYKQFKDASMNMAGLLDEHSMKFKKGVKLEIKTLEKNPTEYFKNITVFDLISILNDTLDRMSENNIFETNVEEYHIDEKLEMIRHQLINSGKISFNKLIESLKTKLEIIVTFLALLELIRNEEISIIQQTPFSGLDIARA